MQFHRNGICHRFADVLKRKVRNVFARVGKRVEHPIRFFNFLFWYLPVSFHRTFDPLASMILPTTTHAHTHTVTHEERTKRVRRWNNHVKINKINDYVRPSTRERFYIELDFIGGRWKWMKWNNGINMMFSFKISIQCTNMHAHNAIHNLMAYLC